MIKEIANIVKEIAGNDYLYFDTALQIKKSPHHLLFNAWAVSVSPNNEVYVMDSNQDWFLVQEADTLVVASLYQRVSTIKKQTA